MPHMTPMLCHLVHGFNKPTFGMLKLPAVPHEGDTLIVGKHGSDETKAYLVKGVGYRGIDQSVAVSDDASEAFVVLKAEEKG